MVFDLLSGLASSHKLRNLTPVSEPMPTIIKKLTFQALRT